MPDPIKNEQRMFAFTEAVDRAFGDELATPDPGPAGVGKPCDCARDDPEVSDGEAGT